MYESLLYENESNALDFKSEQYKFIGEEPHIKCELLKDILAFANSWRRINAVILIGVKEVKGDKAEVIGLNTSDLDDAQLQEFVNSKTNIPIDFSYKTINLEGEKIGVIDIQHKQRPIFLTKDYGKLKKNLVYLRRGSSTVVAKPDEIAEMGHQESEESISPNLTLEFCRPEEELTIGGELNLSAELISLGNNNSIPDFEGDEDYLKTKGYEQLNIMKSPNHDFYKKLVYYYFFQKIKTEIFFSLQNTSSILATSVMIYIDIEKIDKVSFDEDHNLPKLIDKYSELYDLPINSNLSNIIPLNNITLKEGSSKWRITIDVGKIYPNDTCFIANGVVLLSGVSHKTELKCTIVGDNIPQPIKTNLMIECNTSKITMDLDDIVEYHQMVSK